MHPDTSLGCSQVAGKLLKPHYVDSCPTSRAKATMPFVDADVHAHLSRKRRWQGDADADDIHGLYRPDQPDGIFFLNHDQPGARPRKIAPFKRPRILNSSIDTAANCGDVDVQQYPSRRRKASPVQQQQQQTTDGRPPLLAPCHVCHRKPTKKSHLDSFADCQGCGERTCFVCIRQCYGRVTTAEEGGEGSLEEQEMLSRSFQMEDFTNDGDVTSATQDQQDQQQHLSPASGTGMEHVRAHGQSQKGWHARGHRSVICSRCCVERGAEGDVVCLGCLSGMEGV